MYPKKPLFQCSEFAQILHGLHMTSAEEKKRTRRRMKFRLVSANAYVKVSSKNIILFISVLLGLALSWCGVRIQIINIPNALLHPTTRDTSGVTSQLSLVTLFQQTQQSTQGTEAKVHLNICKVN